MVLTEKCTPKQGRQVQISGLTGLGATCYPCQGHAAAWGDFNAQLHASQNLVGRSSTPRENTGVKDESFQRFVESHRLVALNTWSSGRGHTYVQGDARTQIDYIFTFPNSSRGQAKQAKPVPQLGLGGWKKGGHFPILAAVRPAVMTYGPGLSPAPPYCASSLEAAVRAHCPPAQAMHGWTHSCSPQPYPQTPLIAF